MGTNGTLAIKLDGKTIRAYNHYDSYPTWLGERVAKFIRDADVEAVRAQIAQLRFVDEDSKPTPEELELFKGANIWQNVSSGSDWYSALRDLQGNPAGYLTLGIWPTWTWGDNQEWGYLADFDARVLRVTHHGELAANFSFGDLDQDDEGIMAHMERAETAAYA